MKIGILTYHAACNFGANLQVLSTFNYLKKNGYNPIVIDWTTKELEKYYKSSTPSEQFDQHKSFRESHLRLTKKCYDENDIATVIRKEHITAIIIGSDAVMQHHPLLSRIVFPSRKIFSITHVGPDRICPNPFWGSFIPLLNDKPPIAYMSASSQNSAYYLMSKKERIVAKRLLTQFSYISVRDIWTQKMVQYILQDNKQVPITPDPVFAFNINVEEQISKDFIRDKFKLPTNYLLFSFHNSKTVSQKWLNSIKQLAKARGFECVAMPFPDGVNFHHPFDIEIPLPLDPLEWYALLKYSSGFIGHNMHPIVVCLHNAVPFFSFDQYGIPFFRLFANSKSSKIYHILKRFSLEDYRVSCSGIFYKEPDPNYILTKLQNFNHLKIQEVALNLTEEYKQMMHEVMEVLVCKE